MKTTLTWEELQKIIEAVLRRFHKVLRKHPDFGQPAPYLVFAPIIGEGSTSITSLPEQILREFPHMIADSAAKTHALALLAGNKAKPPISPKSSDDERRQRADIIPALTFRTNIYIEVRVDCADTDPSLWQREEADDLWETERLINGGSRRKLPWITIAKIQQDILDSETAKKKPTTRATQKESLRYAKKEARVKRPGQGKERRITRTQEL